jgi:rifampicin phosphotransferase
MSMATSTAAKVEPTTATESGAAPPLRFEAPGPGSWIFDAEHCERPHSRWVSSVLPPIYTAGFREGMARYGVMIDTIECRMVNGFTFICPRPLGAPPDARKPPPKLILQILVRLVPALRRRTRRAAQILESRLWREDARYFFETLWPQALDRFQRLGSLDLEALDDEAFVGHLDELIAIVNEQFHDHFSRHVAGMFPVGDFLVHAIDWTGCSKEEALGLLDGYSPYSIEVLKELDAVTGAIGADPAALERLQQGGAGAAVLEELRALEGPVGAAIEHWLAVVGQRVGSGHHGGGRRGRAS